MTLSRRTLKGLLEYLNGQPDDADVLHWTAELEAALKPRYSKRKPPRAKRPGGKRANTSAVYAAVAERAGEVCECGCGRPLEWLAWGPGKPEMDHQFGRARAESVEECWMLRHDCHEAKRDNREWLEKFIDHARRYGYAHASASALARLEGMVSIRESEQSRLHPQPQDGK
jgi:hypothetical protein